MKKGMYTNASVEMYGIMSLSSPGDLALLYIKSRKFKIAAGGLNIFVYIL